MHQPKPNNINFALISSNFQCVSFVVHLLFLALIGFARQLFILTTLCSSKFHMAALRTLCVAVSSFPHRRLWSRGRDAMRCWRWSARNVLKRVQILLNIWLHMHGAHQINPPSLFRGRVAAWPRGRVAAQCWRLLLFFISFFIHLHFGAAAAAAVVSVHSIARINKLFTWLRWRIFVFAIWIQN